MAPHLAEQAPTADLLTSTASIAATLVAIIGGFLVSRVVALASERTGLQRELTEAEDRLARAQEALAEHDAIADAEELDSAVYDSRDLLVSTNGEVTGSALVQALDLDDYSVGTAQLEKRLDAAAATVRATYELLHRLDQEKNWPAAWDTAQRILSTEGIREDSSLLRKVYDEARRRRQQRLEREAEERRLRAKGGLAGAFAGVRLPAFEMMRVPPLNPSDFLLASGRYAPPPGRDALEAAVLDGVAEVQLLRTHLARVAVPPDLRFGFGVLLFFALVGIVYPIVLLSRGEMTLGPWWRGSVVGLFILGLGGVMTYLGWTVRQSTRSLHTGGHDHSKA